MDKKAGDQTHSHEKRSLRDLLVELKSRHLKITKPRKAILAMLAHEHGPFTAEEVHRRIPRNICDLVTVYRTLTSLEKAGLIRRCEFGDGTARYELSVKQDQHHHHLICSECRRVETVEACYLDECHRRDIERVAKRKGFSNVYHTLEFFGTCADCAG